MKTFLAFLNWPERGMSNSVCFHVCHGFVFFARSCVLTTLQSYNVTIHICPLQNSVWVHCQPPRVQELTPELLTLIQDCYFLLRKKPPLETLKFCKLMTLANPSALRNTWNGMSIVWGSVSSLVNGQVLQNQNHCIVDQIQNKKSSTMPSFPP